MSDSFDLSELYTDFRDEGREQVGALDDALLRIEREGVLGEDERAALLRGLHTLKGNSGMLGLRPLQDRVHALESIFKTPDVTLSAPDIDALREAGALLRRAVERAGTAGQDEALAALAGIRLPTPSTAPAASPATPPPSAAPPSAAWSEGDAGSATSAPSTAAPEAEAAIRAPAPTSTSPTSPMPMEASANADGQAAAAPSDPAEPASVPAGRAGDVLPAADELRDEVLRIPFARLDTLLHRAGELQSAVSALEMWGAENRAALQAASLRRGLAERIDALAAAADAVRTTAARLRTVPVGRLFGRFPALAADLARAQGKRLRVELEGEDTELDKSTVDALAEPLLHLVRNAVDHGVETPEARAAAGKPPEATLRLSAVQEGDMVRIEVEDDGAGLDIGAIVARARELGWVAEGGQPGEAEAAAMIFTPGFSTRREATELSGRGIGLDVVHTTVSRLRGSVEAEPGGDGGTRFVLRLPLTVALVPALFFESAGEVLALAASDVEAVARVGALERVGAAEVMELHGEALPVIRLPGVFGWPVPAAEPRLAVVVRRGERGAAILVDRLLDQRAATLRPLPEALGAPAGVSGATVSVDGRVVLLLDAGEMMELNVDFYRGAGRGG